MTRLDHVAASFACAAALLILACGAHQSDLEIATKIDQQISNSPGLGETQIGVASHDGVVTLSGVVASEEQAARAERLAWSVEGVDAVETRLEVSPPPVGAE